MTFYSYTAIDANGRRVSGEIGGSDPDSVVAELTARGLQVEKVQARGAGFGSAGGEDKPASALTSADAREIGGHVAEIVSAGLPLEAGLAAIAEEFPRGRLKWILRRVVRQLESGTDLETVLAAQGAPQYMPALVRAGARSGRIGQVLESFIASAQVVSDLRQMMWMALAYPLAMLLVVVPLGFILFRWLIPQFAGIFDGFEINLPIITSALLTFSEFLNKGWPALAIVVCVLVVTCVVLRLALGAAMARRLACRVPLIGPIVRWTALARFSPVLSVLVESGVPLDEALILAAEASGDAALCADCRILAMQVREGEPLQSAAQGRLPSSFVRALSWEREREGFPEVLQSMAEMYAGRARAVVALLAALLPGLFILTLGSVIGFIVIALFMPLFELLNKLS